MKRPLGGKYTTLDGDAATVPCGVIVTGVPTVMVAVPRVDTAGFVSAALGWLFVDSETVGVAIVDWSTGRDGEGVCASTEEVAAPLTEERRMGWVSLIGVSWRAWLGITTDRENRSVLLPRGQHVRF